MRRQLSGWEGLIVEITVKVVEVGILVKVRVRNLVMY